MKASVFILFFLFFVPLFIMLGFSCNGIQATGRSNNDTIVQKQYYANGKLQEEYYLFDYTNGDTLHADGARKTYYDNGQLKLELHYKKGKKDGFEKKYYENGNLEHIGILKNGLEDSTWIRYYDNKDIHDVYNYMDGNSFGESFTYFRNNKIYKYRFVSHYNGLKYLRVYDSTGNITEEKGFPFTVSLGDDTLSVDSFYEPWIYIGALPDWDINIIVKDITKGHEKIIKKVNGAEMDKTIYGRVIKMKESCKIKGVNNWEIDMNIYDKKYQMTLNLAYPLVFIVK